MGSGRMGGPRLPSLKTIAGAVMRSLHWTIHYLLEDYHFNKVIIIYFSYIIIIIFIFS